MKEAFAARLVDFWDICNDLNRQDFSRKNYTMSEFTALQEISMNSLTSLWQATGRVLITCHNERLEYY